MFLMVKATSFYQESKLLLLYLKHLSVEKNFWRFIITPMVSKLMILVNFFFRILLCMRFEIFYSPDVLLGTAKLIYSHLVTCTKKVTTWLPVLVMRLGVGQSDRPHRGGIAHATGIPLNIIRVNQSHKSIWKCNCKRY